MPDTDLLTAPETIGFAGTPPAPSPTPGKPPVRQMLPDVRAKLAELAGTGAALPFTETEDSLAPARGLAVAVGLVTPFWAVVGAGLWAMLK